MDKELRFFFCSVERGRVVEGLHTGAATPQLSTQGVLRSHPRASSIVLVEPVADWDTHFCVTGICGKTIRLEMEALSSVGSDQPLGFDARKVRDGPPFSCPTLVPFRPIPPRTHSIILLNTPTPNSCEVTFEAQVG